MHVIDTDSRYGRQLSGDMGHDALTSDGYDIADQVTAWLESHPGFHTPSTIGRGVKIRGAAIHSNYVWQVLVWMEKHVLVNGSGNGVRRRYGAR